MRLPGEQDVVELQQRAVCRQGFDFEDIETRCRDAVGLQDFNQRLLVYNLSACGIYQYGVLLHEAKGTTINQFDRFFGTRAGDKNDQID